MGTRKTATHFLPRPSPGVPCGGRAPMPCGISASYWQPHNSGKGVPGVGAGGQRHRGTPALSRPAASQVRPSAISPSSHCPAAPRAEGQCACPATPGRPPQRAELCPSLEESEFLLYLVSFGFDFCLLGGRLDPRGRGAGVWGPGLPSSEGPQAGPAGAEACLPRLSPPPRFCVTRVAGDSFK